MMSFFIEELDREKGGWLTAEIPFRPRPCGGQAMNCGSGVAPGARLASIHNFDTKQSTGRERLTHLLSELALATEIELLDDSVVRGAQHLHLRAGHVVAGRHVRGRTAAEGD
jgi:hypothetical protein